MSHAAGFCFHCFFCLECSNCLLTDLYSPSYFINNLSGYRILSWTSCSLKTLQSLLQSLLSFSNIVEKLDDILSSDSLYINGFLLQPSLPPILSLFLSLSQPLRSLSSVIQNIIVIYPDVGLFSFTMVET